MGLLEDLTDSFDENPAIWAGFFLVLIVLFMLFVLPRLTGFANFEGFFVPELDGKGGPDYKDYHDCMTHSGKRKCSPDRHILCKKGADSEGNASEK